MGREHGAQCLASMEIPGMHVLLEEAAISAVLNTLHGSHGDEPKPLHDLAPNKHAEDGKRALASPDVGKQRAHPGHAPALQAGGAGGHGARPCCSLDPGLGSCLPCSAPERVFPKVKPSFSLAQRPLHLQELFTDKLHKFGGQPFYHSWQLCALPATR